MKKLAGDNEELKNQIKHMQDSNKNKIAEYENKLKQLKIDSAVELELTKAKAKNIKAARALLDLSNVEIDGNTVIRLG